MGTLPAWYGREPLRGRLASFSFVRLQVVRPVRRLGPTSCGVVDRRRVVFDQWREWTTLRCVDADHEVDAAVVLEGNVVPLRDRCIFGRFPWLISQALSVTYMAGERRLYLERNCRLPESPAHSRRRNREGPASSKGLNSQRGFGPAVEPRRKSRPRSTSLHGSSPCKCQRLSTLRWDRLPPSRPSTKSGARAGGRRLSDRRLHRWLAGTSASAPSSHGAADLLGLNRAHICVRNR